MSSSFNLKPMRQTNFESIVVWGKQDIYIFCYVYTAQCEWVCSCLWQLRLTICFSCSSMMVRRLQSYWYHFSEYTVYSVWWGNIRSIRNEIKNKINLNFAEMKDHWWTSFHITYVFLLVFTEKKKFDYRFSSFSYYNFNCIL